MLEADLADDLVGKHIPHTVTGQHESHMFGGGDEEGGDVWLSDTGASSAATVVQYSTVIEKNRIRYVYSWNVFTN